MSLRGASLPNGRQRRGNLVVNALALMHSSRLPRFTRNDMVFSYARSLFHTLIQKNKYSFPDKFSIKHRSEMRRTGNYDQFIFYTRLC